MILGRLIAAGRLGPHSPPVLRLAPRWFGSSSPSAAPLTPEQRIKALEVQLREANEKARLFEAVLDVLKKDYGVRVVKKPSGKSSRKSSSRG